MSAGLIFGGDAETLGFDCAFLMASIGDGEVATGVLADIPVGPTVVDFDPSDVKQGSWIEISYLAEKF